MCFSKGGNSILSQPKNLFDVVLSMHQVEFAPFGSGQRAQDGMGSHQFVAVEPGFGFRNYPVHPLKVLKHFLRHSLRRQIARIDGLRRFPARWKVPEIDDRDSPPTLAYPITIASAAHRQAFFEILDRAKIREIEVIEHLENAPVALPMAG